MTLTNAEYVNKRGAICPNCESHNLEGYHIEVTESGAYQNVMCLDCNAEWTDEYSLDGYSKLTVPEETV